MWVCFGSGGILSCSDWHKIVLLFPLHIARNFENHAAHRTPPLFAVCSQKQHQKDTSRAAVQCTSSLLIPCAHVDLNVKHHRTTETGDTYHSRESRSCAGEKIEHQNEYNKRNSSSSAGMYVYKRC